MAALSDDAAPASYGEPRRNIAIARTTAKVRAKAGQNVYRKWLAGTIGKYPKT